MLLNKISFGAALLLFAASPAWAETPQCPATVTVKDIALDKLPADWKMAPVGPQIHLISTGVTDGPIEQMAELIPASSLETKGGSTIVWKFPNAYPDGLWLRCSYGGSLIKIGHPLPAGVKECTLKTENDKSTLDCK